MTALGGPDKRLLFRPAFHAEGLNIYGIGLNHVGPASVRDDPVGLPGFSFMLFHDPVEVEADGRMLEAPPESLVVFAPRTRMRYGSSAGFWRHSWLLADGAWLQKEICGCSLPLNSLICPADPLASSKHLTGIYSEVYRIREPDGQILRNLLQNWFRDLRRLLEEGFTPSLPPAMVAVKYFILSNLDRRLTLKLLADQSWMSVSSFSRQFRHFYGVSPIQYIISVRMIHAAYLLREGCHSVTRAANQVGYENVSLFARHFKRQFGISPVNMRRYGKQRLDVALMGIGMDRAQMMIREGCLRIREIARAMGYLDVEAFKRDFQRYVGEGLEDIIRKQGVEPARSSRP